MKKVLTGIVLLAGIVFVAWVILQLVRRAPGDDATKQVAEPVSSPILPVSSPSSSVPSPVSVVPVEVSPTTDLLPVATPAEQPASESSRILRRYAGNLSSEEKIDLLDDLSMATDGLEDALAVIRLAMMDADPAVRRQALLVLSSNGLFFNVDLTELINKGLKDAEAEVREAAFTVLESVGVGRYPEIITGLLDASDEAVLQKAMELINTPKTILPISIYEKAMRSTNPVVRYDTLGIVRSQEHKRGITLLIDALKDADPSVRAEAEHSLFFLLDESFDSYEQAAAFWSSNSSRFAPNIPDTFADPSESDSNAESSAPAPSAPPPPGVGSPL